MDNIVTKEGANLVEVYRANNTYLNVSAEIKDMQSALVTDQKTQIWRVGNNIEKALKDGSGQQLTPEGRVFFADAEGRAANDEKLSYSDGSLKGLDGIVFGTDNYKAKLELSIENNKPVFTIYLSNDGGNTWKTKQKLVF